MLFLLLLHIFILSSHIRSSLASAVFTQIFQSKFGIRFLFKACFLNYSMLRGSLVTTAWHRPQVADEGDGLQMWMVASNILTKQSQTGDGEWSSSLGVGRGAKSFYHKKISFLRKFTKGRTWTDSLNKLPKLRKINVRFGTWNIRSRYRTGSLMTVAKELSKYKLDP
jgi:hypothetical protein